MLEWLIGAGLFVLMLVYRLRHRVDPDVLPDTPARRRLNLQHERQQRREWD